MQQNNVFVDNHIAHICSRKHIISQQRQSKTSTSLAKIHKNHSLLSNCFQKMKICILCNRYFYQKSVTK